MERKGEVTVYLSLIFVLLITLIGALIESASIQMLKNYKRADINRAIECMFAEYQKELLEEYDVFALEGTYETGIYSEEQMADRLDFYAGENINHAIERIQFLSDDNAKGFYEQVIYYMEHKYGISKFTDKTGITEIWKQQEKKAENYEDTQKKYQNKLDGLLEENEGQLSEEGNPLTYMDELKKMSILDLVMPKEKPISEKSISLGDTVSHRERQEGYGDFSDMEKESSTVSNLLFGQYILDHFSEATSKEAGGALDYEIEYMIGGKQSDRENLKEVVKKLLLLRFVPNYAYLQSSAEKKAEAEALALTLSAVMAVPAVTEAVAQMILLIWAYGEAIMDMRTLLNGGKVPLTKTDSSWQLSLSGLMELKDYGKVSDGKDSEDGMEYKEYLRILLFLCKKETVSMRALDVIEQNLRSVHGMDFFRVDCCISRIEIQSTCQFRRGITYQFSTYYGYR